MCVIIHKPKNVQIDEEILRMCWDHNKDGAGIMFSENNKLNIYKGYMHFKSFYEVYDYFKDKELLMHFRFATLGLVHPLMCHPFKSHKNLGVMHNGILNIDLIDEYGQDSVVSDSFWFIRSILAKLPENFLDIYHYRKLVEMSIEDSILVFLDNKNNINKIGDLSYSVEFRECWYSNCFWMHTTNLAFYDTVEKFKINDFLKGIK